MKAYLVWGIIFILSFVFLPSVNAEILKWVDKNGKTHYGDQPIGVKDVEVVDGNGLITYSKQSPNKSKIQPTRRIPSRRPPTKKPQQYKQQRSEGSSSSQQPARGSSSRY
jgi:hypothetical protein